MALWQAPLGIPCARPTHRSSLLRARGAGPQEARVASRSRPRCCGATSPCGEGSPAGLSGRARERRLPRRGTNAACQFAARNGGDTDGHEVTPRPRRRHNPRPCPLMSPRVHPCPLSRGDAPPFRNAKVRGSSPLVSTTLTPQRLGTCVVARVDDRRPLGRHCQFAARIGGEFGDDAIDLVDLQVRRPCSGTKDLA